MRPSAFAAQTLTTQIAPSRLYTSSVVWIKIDLGGRTTSGSGFAIGPHLIATNRHVLVNETTDACVDCSSISAIAREGPLKAISVHLPTWGADDVAILQVCSDSPALTPLRLGFSELVEIGERIVTIGFPSPESGGFEENLYCNVGLVNRVRPSQVCTERVLEVSIPLHGGISGAPIVNRFGEAIGLLAFSTERRHELGGERTRTEQSFYAVPVELLHRLRAEIGGDR